MSEESDGSGDQTKAQETAEVTEAKKKLDAFLKANKSSSIIEISFDEGDEIEKARAIQNPWGDKSIMLLVAEGDLFYEALNNIILPERLSAVYHRDLKKLEVIWTAYKLPEEHEALRERRFSFRYDGKNHECSFEKASDRLMLIARFSYPTGVSDTHFRNLHSFSGFQHQDKEEEGLRSYGEPTCFWIDNIEAINDNTLDLIRHINFHIKYFDTSSPTVVIHAKSHSVTVKPRERYIAGEFPKQIESRKLNPTLLSFFAAAFEYDDPARQFQYFFRVIEYASGYYLESKSRTAVKKALMAPNAATDVNRVASKVIDAMLGYKADDSARFTATIEDLVDVDLIWREIRSNANAFTTETVFEGGFTLKALVTRAGPDDEFGSRGLQTMGIAFKEIRNHLSHGKDKHTGNAILPTSRNFNLLRPWVHLIAIAAGEVALFEGIA